MLTRAVEAVDPRERARPNIANAVRRRQRCKVKKHARGAVARWKRGNVQRSFTIAHAVFPQTLLPRSVFSLAYDTGHGFTFQTPSAYSEIVRSLENFPEPATFRMALCAQAFGSAYNRAKRSCAST